MTALTNKFQELTKQFQQLTIWKPNERDALVELDRWRTDAHITIEQVYNKKRHLIEQLSEKHEREFLRQLTRHRLALNNIQKKLPARKDSHTARVREFNETSILNELHKLESDINTSLGRAEIIIDAIPFNCNDSISLRLKTYLALTPAIHSNEYSIKSSAEKSPRRSTGEAQRAHDNRLQMKKNEETVHRELQSARQQERQLKLIEAEKAFNQWRHRKQASGAFKKHITDINNDSMIQETIKT